MGIDTSAPEAGLGGRYGIAGRPDIRVAAVDLGLACCAVEFGAAVTRGLLVPTPLEGDAIQGGSDEVPATSILVVSGTLTHRGGPALLRSWESLAGRRLVLALGACATSGGPYWDSYAVVPGIDSVVPVASYVPGCPPRPEALVEALIALADAA